MEKIVLIPAYKPGENLTALVQALHGSGLKIVVVDDGSGAAYAAVFESVKSYAAVVTCSENGGKGTALKHGFAFIREHFAPPYCVTTADADGQHRVQDILAAAQTAAEHPGAMVLGCRAQNKEMPMRNRLGNLYTKLAFFLSSGRYVRDTQTGLRGFSDDALPFLLSVPGKRYEYEMNVLLWWTRHGKSVCEVPIQTLYINGNATSHFKAVSDSLKIYSKILRFSAPHFFAFAADVLLFAALFFGLNPFADGMLFIANIAARILSGTLHFLLLKQADRAVRLKKHLSVLRYSLLALAILVPNTLLLWWFVSLHVAVIWAKILSNVCMFFACVAFYRGLMYQDTK